MESGLSAGGGGLLGSHRAGARRGGGLDQFIADGEEQEVSVDGNVASFAAVMAADADQTPLATARWSACRERPGPRSLSGSPLACRESVGHWRLAAVAEIGRRLLDRLNLVLNLGISLPAGDDGLTHLSQLMPLRLVKKR